MAKKNYTQAGARRAVASMMAKLLKLHEDGHVSAQKYVNLGRELVRLEKSIK